MKKEFDLKVLKNADKGTIEKLAERYPASSNKDKEKIYRMAMRKSANCTNTAHADIVKGVDLYRRPKWYRPAAVAASFLIVVAGITGTFYAVSNFRIPDESDTSYYHQIEETTSSTTSEFDITTKEGIYQKMQSSVYYYDKVSGEMVLSTENSTESLVVDFEADLERSLSFSNSEKIKINVDNTKYVSGNEQLTYCDGTHIYHSDVLLKQNEQIGFAAKRGEMPAANDDPTRYADVTNLPYVSAALIPRLSVLDLIDNSENWEISGNDTYLGRECTIITGDVKGDYADESGILGYSLCVDNKTGVILKYFASDLSGEYQHVMLMRNIAFDDDVEVRDLTEYIRSNSLSSYDTENSLPLISAVVGINGKTGFIMSLNVLADNNSEERPVLNVYDTDLKTVIDKFSFGNIEAEGEEIG